jgi:hypothetical protein
MKSGKTFQMMKCFCFVISITDLNMPNIGLDIEDHDEDESGGGDFCLIALANNLFYIFTYL